MKRKQPQIILRLPTTDPQEFVAEYRDAVFEVLSLIFERRELDLKESQLQAMSLLVRAAQNMDVFPKQ